MSPERKRIILRSVLFLTAALAALLLGITGIDRLLNKEFSETRSEGTWEFMQAGETEADGKKYRKTPAVTTLLLAGIDRSADAYQGVSTSRYRSGGQADFLLLLAIDHTNKCIHQLQIDRDTMTDVTVLSVYGRETGSRVMQICLSHNYGANSTDNARYTLRAVKNLMGDIELDSYCMVDYSAVAAFNDLLGGVRVTIPDDMTSVNPAWTRGSAVTLSGGEAETFVRARKTIGEGTNEERMRRQSEFMQKAAAQLRENLSSNPEFGAKLLKTLRKNAVTNLSDQQWLEEMQRSGGYEILPVEYLDGEYKVGESGYMEFYAEENSASSWIRRHLYTPEQP